MRTKCLALAIASLLASQAFADDAASFKDLKQQESYAIGAQTARTLRQDNVDIDVDMLVRGLRDGLSDGKLMMTDKELRAVMSRVQQELHKNMVTNRRATGGEGEKKASQKSENSSHVALIRVSACADGSVKLLRKQEEWGIRNSCGSTPFRSLELWSIK